MRFTGLGIKAALFYLLLLGAFFAAPYANLFFLLLVFLTLLGAASALATRRNLRGVSARIEEIDPAPSGAGATFRVHLDPGGRRRFALEVELVLAGGIRAAAPAPVLAEETALAGVLPPLPRGVYPVVAARVVSAWPLGLLRARTAIEAPAEVVVYPAPAELATTRDGGGGSGDLYDALGAADGFLQPSHLREYRPGDELRLVHWRASARRSELVIKEWEGGTGSGHEVLLDRRVGEEALEGALRAISALALAARDQKELLTVHTQGLSETFGGARRPWRELLAFLARAEVLPPHGAPPPPVAPTVLRLPRTRGGAA